MTAIIILAAGTSSRLGEPKQTLRYRDESLLKHSIKAAKDSDIGPVVVVIGANEKEISAHIENEAITVVYNEDFKEGLASSIKAGLTNLLDADHGPDAVILMVCDQPYVDGNLLQTLVRAKVATGKPIVACAYKDTIGVPALFDKSLFSELLSLEGEEGGKKILYKHKESVATIPFPAGDIDIDTASDYQALLNSERK